MVLIGFLLLTAAAIFGIDVVAQNQYAIDIDAFNQVFTTTPAAVLTAGIVTGVCAAVGMMLLRDGLLRRHELRIANKQIALERDRLAAAMAEDYPDRHFDGGAFDRERLDLREGERVSSF